MKSDQTNQPTDQAKPDNSQTGRRVASCFVRFSTAAQASGDSQRRQHLLCEYHAKKYNRNIDRSLTGHGDSTYHGTNLSANGLGQFVPSIHHGRVKSGPVLLVGEFDRTSREEYATQVSLCLSILRAGVEIVTLADPRSPAEESVNADVSHLIISILSMIQMNQESKLLSNRKKTLSQFKRRQ
jgi:DNA invertase Pin-like site-specific DNA recombinase